MLEQKLLPSAADLYNGQPWTFKDDGAPCHRSGCAKKSVMSKKFSTLGWLGTHQTSTQSKIYGLF